MEKCFIRNKWFMFRKVGSEDHHCFEHVYDHTHSESMPPTGRIKCNGDFTIIKDIKNRQDNKLYVKSVCKYCGMEIQR